MDIHDQDTERLRQTIEALAGRKMQTPKDFDYLSEQIFEKVHQSVSPTTLKRMWGYLSETTVPRISTLNILSQFAGYDSWNAFCQAGDTSGKTEESPHSAESSTETPANPSTGESTEKTTNPSTGESTETPANPSTGESTETPANPSTGESTEEPANPSTGDSTETPANPPTGESTEMPADPSTEKAAEKAAEEPPVKSRRWSMKWIAAIVAVAAIAAVTWFNLRQPSQSPASYILRQGDHFSTYMDYLKLFGINDSAKYWGRVLPHHPSIVVWGPEYHHPYWHNEGNRDSMMPTITERWEPADVDKEFVAMRNRDKYDHEVRLNEVRITFMKNLVDTGYVFVGVYRLSLQQSDTSRCVWERVAEECNLDHLDYLNELRN